jgi:hypothetical protein
MCSECETMHTLQLVVRLKGATDAELLRAGLAAMAVFEKAGVTPVQAAEAAFAREGYDLSGFDPEHKGYNAEQAAIAHLWDEGARAAAKAGCAEWPAGAEPETAELEIVAVPEVDDDDDEEDDEAEKRQMLATHLASITGREPSEAELDAEYEALIAEMNKATVSRSA